MPEESCAEAGLQPASTPAQRASPAAAEPAAPPAPDGYAGYRDAVAEFRKPGRGSWALLLVLSLIAFVWLRESDQPLRQALVLAGVVLFHELGHVVAMRWLGYRDVRVLFVPFFGALTSASSAPPSRWKQAVVSLAGPVPGLVVSLALFLSPLGEDAIVNEVAWTFLGLNAFNLLPLGFLDGGRVLDGLVFQRHRVLEAVFAGLSALVFLGLAWSQGDWVLAVVGVGSLVGVRHAFRRASAVPELKGRLDPGEVTVLPEHQLMVLYATAVGVAGPGGKASTHATLMRDLHLRATTPPASRCATLALTLTWLFALLSSIGIAGVGTARVPDLGARPTVTSPGASLTPTFRWTPGTRAAVEIRRVTSRTQGPETNRDGETKRTRFTVEAAEQGGVSLRFESVAPEPTVHEAAPDRFTATVRRHGFGTLTATAEGELAAVAATPQVERAIADALAPHAGGDPELHALKERTLRWGAESPMREFWRDVVDAVPRIELAPGVEVRVERKDAPVHSVVTYRLEGRVPCKGERDDATCALVTYRVAHDEAALAEEVRAYTERMTGKPLPGPLGVKVEIAGFVVFEERTMFPRVAYCSRQHRWTGAKEWEDREFTRYEFQAEP